MRILLGDSVREGGGSGDRTAALPALSQRIIAPRRPRQLPSRVAQVRGDGVAQLRRWLVKVVARVCFVEGVAVGGGKWWDVVVGWLFDGDVVVERDVFFSLLARS